jgi:hypothetical protein
MVIAAQLFGSVAKLGTRGRQGRSILRDARFRHQMKTPVTDKTTTTRPDTVSKTR